MSMKTKNVWLGTSGKGLTRYNPKTKTWKTFIHDPKRLEKLGKQPRDESLRDKNGKLWVGYQDEGLSIFNLDTEQFQHFNTESTVKQPGATVWKIFQDSKKKVLAIVPEMMVLIWFDPEKGALKQFVP